MSAHRTFVRAVGPGRDRGAVVPLTALCLVIMLIFTAFAVDLGRLYGERRQDQSAADSGALSGAFQLLLSGNPGDQFLFDQITTITYDDLDPNTRPSTLAAWQAQWPACSDPNAPAVYTKPIKPSIGTIDCIRKSSFGTAIRVRLPQRNVSTFFAGVMGIKTLATTAEAEAGLSAVTTGVLPFAVAATSSAGGVICLKQPPNGLSTSDVCPGSNSGVFGYLASPRPSWPVNQSCNGGQNETVQQNIAQGIDHNFQVWDRGADIPDLCTGNAVVGTPNYLNFQTGNISSTIEDGFITGAQEGNIFADAGPARLARPSPCVVGGGDQALPQQPAKNLEWCGVWSYMQPASVGTTDLTTQIPQQCYDLRVDAAKHNLGGVTDCFAAYALGVNGVSYSSQLFTDNIQLADRFAWIPESVEPLDKTRQFHIQRFRPVFVQTIYYGDGNTFLAYNPGELLPLDKCKCKNFSQVTALLFDGNMLPADLRTPSSNNNSRSQIALIR
jgi:hypothetical protein